MAYVNSRTASSGIMARVYGLVAMVKEAAERRSVYNTTLNELSCLTDRDLNDLGIARGSISDVAYQAAYRK